MVQAARKQRVVDSLGFMRTDEKQHLLPAELPTDMWDLHIEADERTQVPWTMYYAFLMYNIHIMYDMMLCNIYKSITYQNTTYLG